MDLPRSAASAHKQEAIFNIRQILTFQMSTTASKQGTAALPEFKHATSSVRDDFVK